MQDAGRRQGGQAAALGREPRLRRLLDQAGIGLYAVLPNGAIAWANQAMLDLLGYRSDELVGRQAREIFAEPSSLENDAARQDGQTLLRRKDGAVVHAWMTVQPAEEPGGETIHLARDITATVLAEGRREATEERSRAFIANSTEGIWCVDLDHPIDPAWSVDEQIRRCYDWAYLAEGNDALARMYGYERASQLAGARLADLMPASSQRNMEYLRAFVESGYRLLDGESEERDRYGNKRYFLNNLVGVLENGKLVRAWGSQRDITERKRMEIALRESEGRFMSFMKHLPAAAWIKDRDGRYVYANPEGERVFQTPLEALVGKTDGEVFAPATAAQFRHNDELALEQGAIQASELLEHEDGIHESVVSKFSIHDQNGAPALVGGVAVDITERLRAEAALRQSEERQRLAADAGKVGLWDWDITSNSIIWSDRVYEFHGLQPGEFNGTVEAFSQLVHPDDFAHVSTALREALEGRKPYELEFRAVRPSGEVRWIATSARVIRDEAGHPVRMLGATLDTTERRLAEEALKRSNAELEEFAYAVSHDLQEPLRMINIYAELLVRRFESFQDGETSSFRAYIQKGVRQMETLIGDLLSYSRAIHYEEFEVEQTELARALEQAIAILEPRIRESQASIGVGPLPRVKGDETQLTLIFQNLLSNALKYRKSGETVRISIDARRDGPLWVVSVRDNGIGFDPQYARRIFGLFKRLHKDAYPGTGLGLAICKRIIERYGGSIWAESVPGEGSTFCFSLPAAS